MALRRADNCVECGGDLAEGTKAEWDSGRRAVTCIPCVAARPAPGTRVSTAVASGAALPEAQVTPMPPIDVGVPGASARKEHARRQAKRERQIEEKWGSGRIGKIAKALSDDPQSTQAWKDGAIGEERVAEILQERLGQSAVLLHDRKVPGTRGNVDHLAIAATGVWIIDAKRYKGKVEQRDKGGWFSSDIRLYVGGRDRSKLVGGMDWQHAAVRAALGEEAVPVHRALTFVGAEWPLFFRKPLRIDGVWVSWPAKLADLIGQPGSLGSDDIGRVARRLAERLPANRS